MSPAPPPARSACAPTLTLRHLSAVPGPGGAPGWTAAAELELRDADGQVALTWHTDDVHAMLHQLRAEGRFETVDALVDAYAHGGPGPAAVVTWVVQGEGRAPREVVFPRGAYARQLAAVHAALGAWVAAQPAAVADYLAERAGQSPC